MYKSYTCLFSIGVILLSLSVSVATAKVDKLPRIRFITPSIARIQWDANGNYEGNHTGVCVYPQKKVPVKVIETDTAIIYRSSELTVEVVKPSLAVVFREPKSGRVILHEHLGNPRESETVVKENVVYDDNSARIVDTANGKVTVKNVLRRDTTGCYTRYRCHFVFGDESLYGLGSHMEDYMDLKGKTVYLVQHNLKIAMPVLVSTGGYGLFFDAGCAMKFEDATIEYDAANQLDYYFMKGDNLDKVVAQYRYLTGGVSLQPKYMFGYIQSKERYVSSDDILRTLAEYRRRHIPIDVMVQDWNYWPQGWGYMKMDRKHYPDPKALADSVHALHAKIMISIWPNPMKNPQQADFQKRGWMLGNSVYDAFNPEARKLYWEYADKEFFSNGFAAWWCDSSEPLDADWGNIAETVDGQRYGWDSHERRWQLNKNVLSDCLGADKCNLYSLYHAKGIYENQRAASRQKRVVNLTRSGFAGQQRYGTIVWNGDTHASWESFRQQIPSGLNYIATGNPYWTIDVGSFFTRSDNRWFVKGRFPKGVNDEAFREYYTRMFQWATFMPVLRSHGTDTPREVWRFGEPDTKYYDAILKMINLRYTLLPYIYSMAGAQTVHDYTMVRMLPFDFANDKNVWDLKDEYMFGSILVCPVTAPGAEVRKVYLPDAGDNASWIDYWTGKTYKPGQWVEMEASIDKLPLFVRGGSIIPTSEPTEYAAAQEGRPITIHVYPGRDSRFDLYEDEGDNYNYESGGYTEIPLIWNDKTRKLTIGARKGSFAGMLAKRSFIVLLPDGSRKVVDYSGNRVIVKL